MGMTGSGMADAMTVQVQDIPGINITDLEELQRYHTALGTAIVAYIQDNAVVNAGSFANSGGAVSGTGTVS